MTAVPLPRQPASNPNRPGKYGGDSTPVLALKELVARLNREQNKIQDLLSSLGFALRSLNNLNQFLELIPLMVSRVTDADGGALLMFRNGQVKLERLHCQDGQWGKELRRSLEGVTRQATTALMGVQAADLPIKSLQAYAALDYQVSRVLGDHVQIFGTPVLVKNSERGRLYVFSRSNAESHWTEQRQKLVRLVADQTAVAIGAEIQVQLLPRQYPVINGLELAALCQTASRVGGDYYDFIPYRRTNANGDPSERWSITIGDVMGKGVPAGLIMTMTRGMLRAEVLNGHSPAKVLSHLNQVMYEDLENSNRFVTLFYSEYDPITQILSYSNAAHNPPLLWQAATHTIQRLDTVGMLIGLDANTQFQEAHVQLQPGDVVIYYTDGFTEATNSKGVQFDEPNLLDELNRACVSYRDPQQILQHLFDRVVQFSGLTTPKDDMTLVVLRVKVPGEVREEKAKRRIELPRI
jgi:phosphoserine phosphatase RsbU/P